MREREVQLLAPSSFFSTFSEKPKNKQNKLSIGNDVVEAAWKNHVCVRMKKADMQLTIIVGQTIFTSRSFILNNRREHFRAFFVNRHFLIFGT